MSNEQMDRRGFFTLGMKKTAKAAVDLAQTRVEQRAKRYIRPPFAIEEFDFLIKCSRCDACIKACPQDIIFPLSAKLGIEVVSTPALDLLNGACHLCAEWPCVQACETQALKRPHEVDKTVNETMNEEGTKPLPQLATISIDTSSCLPYLGPECGACGSACPVPGAISWDMTKPKINMQICIGCAMCREACITAPKSITVSST